MDFGTEDELVETIFQVNQSERDIIMVGLKQFGLNITQARTLQFIGENPGAIQKKLSHYLGKPDATTTNILKVLEGRELISRRVQPDNERRKQLFLEPDGQKINQALRQNFGALEKKASESLTAQEKKTLLSLLDRVHAHLNK